MEVVECEDPLGCGGEAATSGAGGETGDAGGVG